MLTCCDRRFMFKMTEHVSKPDGHDRSYCVGRYRIREALDQAVMSRATTRRTSTTTCLNRTKEYD